MGGRRRCGISWNNLRCPPGDCGSILRGSAVLPRGRPPDPDRGRSHGAPSDHHDVPGCRAVVQGEVSGFLCAARNADSLSDAVERFLALAPDAQRAMGAAGRAKMEREYDQALVVDAYRKALAQITRAEPGAR